jgi:ribosomal-protein-alanine N-acetyltransferase
MNLRFRWDQPLPALRTTRLVLRPFVAADAPIVQAFAGARAIADTTLSIPHPYPEGGAAAWIASHADARARGLAVQYAITFADTHADTEADSFIGTVSLGIDRNADLAEMGYWIGEPYWGYGYCTEAALRLLQFAFTDIGLNRVYARYLSRNEASGRVLRKLGMRHEGTLRQHVRKWDVLEDIHVLGVLAVEWRGGQPG